MSNAVYPVLAGQDLSVKWTPRFLNLTQQAVSGAEQRVQLRQYPIYELTLKYEFLRSDTNAEWQTLAGFFMQRSGSADSFLFDNPDDDAVTAQPIGAGTGSQFAYQLVRGFGGFVEPVMWPNVITGVYVNGVLVAPAIAAPAPPTLGSSAAGALAGTTYYVRTTYVETTGGETTGSGESSLAVAANNVLTVAAPAAVAGATGWNVYVSTATGTETKQNASPIAIGTGWTEPTSGLVAGAAPPLSNKTGYTLGPLGLVTFNTAPAAALAITWTGTYYYRARFTEEAVDFERFLMRFWQAGKVDLTASLGNKIP